MTVPSSRPPASRTRRPFTLTTGAIWTVALWLLEHIAFEVTEGARPGAITDIVNIAACVVLSASIVIFAIVRLHAPDASLRATLGFRAPGWGALVRWPLCALAGAGLCPAMSALDDLIAKRWPYDDPEALASMDKLVTSSSRVALVIGVFVVIPIAREIFFRGLLFGELRRCASTRAAIAGTAVLFAAFSFDLRAVPTAILVGLVFGSLRASSGGVIGPIVAQLGFWAVDALPILHGVDPSADVVYPLRWTIAGASLTLMALAGMAVRSAPEPAGAGLNERA